MLSGLHDGPKTVSWPQGDSAHGPFLHELPHTLRADRWILCLHRLCVSPQHPLLTQSSALLLSLLPYSKKEQPTCVSSSPATGTACSVAEAAREAHNSPTRVALLCRANALHGPLNSPKSHLCQRQRSQLPDPSISTHTQTHLCPLPPQYCLRMPTCIPKPCMLALMHIGNHALVNIHSHHLIKSPAAYPSPNRSTYCREDASASAGQASAVLWGQG